MRSSCIFSKFLCIVIVGPCQDMNFCFASNSITYSNVIQSIGLIIVMLPGKDRNDSFFPIFFFSSFASPPCLPAPDPLWLTGLKAPTN